MTVLIQEVNEKKDLKTFINLPWEIYKDDPNWVPPLKIAVQDQLSPNHPFLEHGTITLFLAYKKENVCGRIAAITNKKHNDFHQDQTGFFGFFESINDLEVSEALFEKAESHLRGLGLNKMIGPANPSTNYECGLLVDGFDDPAQTMLTYNPSYYEKLFKNFGLKKVKDLFALDISLDYKIPEIFFKITERIEKSHKVTWRFINKKNWDQEIEFIEQIYNESWEKNWGFVPMSPREFTKLAKDLKPIAEEKLILLIEVGGEPAAFAVGLLDYNQILRKVKNGRLFPTGIFKLLFGKKSITRNRILILGVRPKFRNLGLGPLMYLKLTLASRQLNLKRTEMSWILEDNMDMIKPMKKIGAQIYKTYRMFEKIF